MGNQQAGNGKSAEDVDRIIRNLKASAEDGVIKIDEAHFDQLVSDFKANDEHGHGRQVIYDEHPDVFDEDMMSMFLSFPYPH